MEGMFKSVLSSTVNILVLGLLLFSYASFNSRTAFSNFISEKHLKYSQVSGNFWIKIIYKAHGMPV